MANSEYLKKYYQANKAKHLAYYKERVKCDLCNTDYCRGNKTKHVTTKKHLRLLAVCGKERHAWRRCCFYSRFPRCLNYLICARWTAL